MSGLEIRNLCVDLGRGTSLFRAVNDVSLQVYAGQTLGLVGESGSGKSTLARSVAGLVPVAEGQILLDGRSAPAGTPHIQMVFQDPYSSLNPRMRMADMLCEAVETTRRRGVEARSVSDLFDMVSLASGLLERYPHELSGGQRQRAAIARAMAANPRVLLLDEVTSALDVSVQAKILDMLRTLQTELGFACLFISHDLAVVQSVSQSVAVMYLSRIVEHGASSHVFHSPAHDYTKQLIAAIPGRRAGWRISEASK